MHRGPIDLVINQPVSTPDDSPSISKKVPGKTKPRSNVIQVFLNRLVRHPRVANKQNARRSIRLHDRLNTEFPGSVAPIFLFPRKPGLVANTDVQGET